MWWQQFTIVYSTYSVQRYNTLKHPCTVHNAVSLCVCVPMCLCNAVTECWHFACYNTHSLTHTNAAELFLYSHSHPIHWHSQSMTCCCVYAWRHCVELNCRHFCRSLYVSLSVCFHSSSSSFHLSTFVHVESHVFTVFNCELLWSNGLTCMFFGQLISTICIEKIPEFHFLPAHM